MAVDVSDLRAAVIEWLDDGAERAMEDLGHQAQANASRRSGELADSLEMAVVSTAESGTWEGSVAFTAEHASYQDEGTGIYGPEGVPIEGNPLLSFWWDAAGAQVIVHSVQGSEPTRFFTRVFEDDGDAQWGDALDRALGTLA